MSNTLFVGKVYLHFDELASTNDYARELIAKSKPPEGTVVRAATQSGGRGQFGSQWWSEPGANLTLSVVLYPGFLAVSDQFRLSEAAALAVWDTVMWTVNGASSTVHIKWPNDIYINGRKTAGILIQNSLAGDRLQSAVVGIGLNVNQRAFPEQIPNATSLALEAGGTIDLDMVADTLFVALERRYLQLKTAPATALREKYREQLLGLEEERSFQDKEGRQWRGTIRGVRDDGRLVVDTGGKTLFFAVKEIQML